MDKNEAIKVLEAYYSQYSPKCDVVGIALTLAIDTLKRIEVEKIVKIINIPMDKYSGNKELAQAIVSYLTGDK